jgi:hypothetical protein
MACCFSRISPAMTREPTVIFSVSTALFSGSGKTYTPSVHSPVTLRNTWRTRVRTTGPATLIATSVLTVGTTTYTPSVPVFSSSPASSVSPRVVVGSSCALAMKGMKKSNASSRAIHRSSL